MTPPPSANRTTGTTRHSADEAERQRRAGELVDLVGHGHRLHLRAGERDDLAEKEQTKVARAQRGEARLGRRQVGHRLIVKRQRRAPSPIARTVRKAPLGPPLGRAGDAQPPQPAPPPVAPLPLPPLPLPPLPVLPPPPPLPPPFGADVGTHCPTTHWCLGGQTAPSHASLHAPASQYCPAGQPSGHDGSTHAPVDRVARQRRRAAHAAARVAPGQAQPAGAHLPAADRPRRRTDRRTRRCGR